MQHTKPNSLQKGLKEPYDWDEYAKMYFPKAEELKKTAEEAEKAGEKEKASEYYLFVPLHAFQTMADHDQTKFSCISYLQISCSTIRTTEICLGGGQEGLLQRRRVC